MTDDIPAATQGINRYSGPDYTSVPKPWLEEQLAEIQRLRQQVAALRDAEIDAVTTLKARDLAAWSEIRRLRARVAELEAGAAMTFGTLEQPTDDEPATYTHNVPPSAPPHNERLPIGNDDE